MVFSFTGQGRLSLPSWVLDIGRQSPDIFYTDRSKHRNTDCLTLGIDNLRVLRGRSALQAYTDVMLSFRDQFRELFGTIITDATIGVDSTSLAPCGSLAALCRTGTIHISLFWSLEISNLKNWRCTKLFAQI